MTTPLGATTLERIQRSSWWERSFRRRILTATVAGGLLALLLGVMIFGIALYRIFTVSAQAAAKNQASEVASALATATDPDLNAVLWQARQGNAILEVLTTDRQVVASVGHGQAPSESILTMPTLPRAGQVVADPSAHTLGGDIDMPYTIIARGVQTPHRGELVIVVAQPMALELRTVRLTIFLLALGGLMLLVVLLAYLGTVLNRALGRVEHIRAEVADIKDTRSGARVEMPRGDDEFNRLARTMNDMLDRLDQADAAQRRFVSNASHELRSPLATVRALVETSPEGMDAQTTRMVGTETIRMQKLVDDLLTLARFDDNGVHLNPTDVDVDELLLDEVRRVRSMASPAHINAAVQPIRITGDADRLTQAVRNLVDNALRHSESAVRLSCRLDGGWAVVDVDNDGVPVPEAQRNGVFERFARLDDARARDSGGSGLGLAIVRAMVEAHGGSVSTGEAYDGWCRFELRLPASAEEPGDVVEESGEDPDQEDPSQRDPSQRDPDQAVRTPGEART